MFSRTSGYMKLAKLNYPTVIDKTGNTATVKLPGLSVDDLSRTGNIVPWRFLEWSLHARATVLHGSTFVDFNSLMLDVIFFQGSSRTTISREFYSLIEDMGWHQTFHFYIGFIGNSSLNTVTKMTSPNTGVEIASNTTQLVAVDYDTRRPKRLPVWWTEKYREFVIGNKSLVPKKLVVPTSNTFRYSMTVQWNDHDPNEHTTFISYVKFCFDAAMDAINKHFYTYLADDILLYNVKTFDLAFLGESKAGDNIVITTWQDATNPLVLFFSFTREESVIFQSTIEFHEIIHSKL